MRKAEATSASWKVTRGARIEGQTLWWRGLKKQLRGFSTQEAAMQVGVHYITLRRWLASGEVQPPKSIVRFGKRRLLDWSVDDIGRLRAFKNERDANNKTRAKEILLEQLAIPEVKAKQLAGIERARKDPEISRYRAARIKEGLNTERGRANYIEGQKKRARKLLGLGRKADTDLSSEAAKLRQQGLSHSEIARKLTQEAYSENPGKATKGMKERLRRLRRKSLTPAA
jgi:hypothetical protein